MDYNLSTTWTIVLLLALVWEFAWKGTALWRAAGNKQPGWFIALLVINTVGILPIIYLLTNSTRNSERTDNEKTLSVG